MKLLVSVFLFVILFSCSSQKNKSPHKIDLDGLWYAIEKDTTYWETIFYDSISWTYTYEFGVVERLFHLDSNVMTKYYLDNSKFLEVGISDFKGESFITTYNNFKSKMTRLEINYNINGIVRGDSIERNKYIREFIDRKNLWELNNRKK